MEIGSFLELQLPKGREWYKGETDIASLNTGRMGIWHAFRVTGCKRIWIPIYQCDSIRETFEKKGVEICLYHQDKNFNPIDIKAKDDDAVPIESESLLDTANPFSYVKTYKAIRDWNPDMVIISYWMSWFAPSLGWIARRLKKRCKVISILHNVIPHEPRFFDSPLTKYFLSGAL